MLKFGDRLRAARERKGLSQMDVYRAIGLNNKSLSRYENGTTAPDPDTLRDLIRLYDVSSDYTHSITAPYLGLFWVISLDFFCLYCLYYFLYFCPPKIPVRFWNAFLPPCRPGQFRGTSCTWWPLRSRSRSVNTDLRAAGSVPPRRCL